MDGHIEGRVELWRRNGYWELLIHAPDWVVADLVKSVKDNGGAFTFGNYGGGSFLLLGSDWEHRKQVQRFVSWDTNQAAGQKHRETKAKRG